MNALSKEQHGSTVVQRGQPERQLQVIVWSATELVSQARLYKIKGGRWIVARQPGSPVCGYWELS